MAKKQTSPKGVPRESKVVTDADFVKLGNSLQELSSRMRVLGSLVADLPDKKMKVKSWKRFSEDLNAVIAIANQFHTAYNRAVLSGVNEKTPQRMGLTLRGV